MSVRMKLRLRNALENSARLAAESRAEAGLAAIGQDMLFVNAPMAAQDAAVLHGFGLPEPDGTWTNGAEASLEIRLRSASPGVLYRVALVVLPFEGNGHRASIAIETNACEPREMVAKDSGWVVVEADCYADTEQRPPRLRVEFNVANPVSPAAIGMPGGDNRQLGFKLRSARVEMLDVEPVSSAHDAPSATDPHEPRAAEPLKAAPAPHYVPYAPPVNPASASRWRALLVDRNPLVRVGRWMRRVTLSLNGMHEQVSRFRVEQNRELASLKRTVADLLNDQGLAASERMQTLKKLDDLSQSLSHSQGHVASLVELNADKLSRLVEIQSSLREAAVDLATSSRAAIEAHGAIAVIAHDNAGRLEGIAKAQEKLGASAADIAAGAIKVAESHEAVAQIARENADRLDHLLEAQSTLGAFAADTAARVREAAESQEAFSRMGQENAGKLDGLGTTQLRLESSLNDTAVHVAAAVAVAEESRGQTVDALRLLQSAHLKLDNWLTVQESSARLLDSLNDRGTSIDTRIDAQQILLTQALGLVQANADSVAATNHTLLRRLVLSHQDGWIIHTDFGFFSCDRSDDLLAAYLAESGDLERGLRLLLSRLLKRGDVVIDVGANIGLHTVVCAAAVGTEGTVYAVEASPLTLRHLQNSLRLNGLETRVVVLPVAAGATAGHLIPFHVGRISGHSSLYPLSGEVETVQVEVATLDSLVGNSKVDLVKIDVEGAELDVLAGMRAMVEANGDLAIVAEFAPSHLTRAHTTIGQWQAAFDGYGFHAFAIDDLTGECARLDSLESVPPDASINVLFARPGTRFWTQAQGFVDG